MAIMGTHGIKLEKLADMRKYCKPDFRKENLWQKTIRNIMTIIRVINVTQETLATVGKRNSVARYVNTMVALIVKTATRWIYNHISISIQK